MCIRDRSSTVWSKAGFNLARAVLSSRVEDIELEVLDITPERIGRFDLVLFLGVLYHMKHPFLALERVFSVTKEHLILETHIHEGLARHPAMVFYPGATLSADSTNWWGPNSRAVLAMLREVGFREAKVVWKSPLWRSCASAIKSLVAPATGGAMEGAETVSTQGLLTKVHHRRAVFHAWR